MKTVPSRELLLDVTRLAWRVWRRKLPTGIDRVCLEYLEHFGPRSLAVLQLLGQTFVLSPEGSDRFFAALKKPSSWSRMSLVLAGLMAFVKASRKPPAAGMLYLNVGHTGLHEPALPRWINDNGVRAIYLIHDLIPITHPQFCRSGEAEKHSRRMTNALASASGIIGNSQATLDELAKFSADHALPMPPSIVAWISGKRASHQQTNEPRLMEPYFVTVGTIEARKNHILLLRVWSALRRDLRDSSPTLLVIGQRGWEADEAISALDDAANQTGEIRELGHCDDDEQDRLVSGARALLMPSFVEGFGLPVLEALQVETPVIASDLPVYREIFGDIPTYVDPADAEAWTRAIHSFLEGGPERARQLEALKQFRAPSWNGHFQTVERFMQTLEAATL